jgi:hypothetical protein
MPWLAAVAAVGGSLMGANQAQKDRDAANDARKQALAQFSGMEAPDIEKMLLNLQQYESAGSYNPEMEQLVNLGPTAMEGISLDPQTRAAQMDALQKMSGYASGQLQEGDLAAFELAKRDAAGQDQAKQNQILQEMQQRGQAGSGAELLARLKSSQSSADRLNQAGLEQAKQIQNARMAALQNQSTMANQLHSQDYGEQSNLAKAKDLISQFNTQNAQSLNTRNTGSLNNAQQTNLSNLQNIRNLNTQTANNQQISNKGLVQKDFDNKINLGAARSGQYNNVANSKDSQAGQTAGMWAGVGQGIGNMVSAYNNKPKTNTDDSEG